MTKINWTLADGKEIEIEVDDEIAEIEIQSRQDQERDHWRNKKRKAKGKDYASLDYLRDRNVQIRDKTQDIPEQVLAFIDVESMYNALKRLPAFHQELVEQVFFKNRQLKDIAAEEGVTYQAIQSRLKKILQKLKIYLS